MVMASYLEFCGGLYRGSGLRVLGCLGIGISLIYKKEFDNLDFEFVLMCNFLIIKNIPSHLKIDMSLFC